MEIIAIHTWKHLDIKLHLGNSLAVQWLGLHAFTAKGTGSIINKYIKIKNTKNKITFNFSTFSKILSCVQFHYPQEIRFMPGYSSGSPLSIDNHRIR